MKRILTYFYITVMMITLIIGWLDIRRGIFEDKTKVIISIGICMLILMISTVDKRAKKR